MLRRTGRLICGSQRGIVLSRRNLPCPSIDRGQPVLQIRGAIIQRQERQSVRRVPLALLSARDQLDPHIAQEGEQRLF
jgi:hypothetical protein